MTVIMLRRHQLELQAWEAKVERLEDRLEDREQELESDLGEAEHRLEESEYKRSDLEEQLSRTMESLRQSNQALLYQLLKDHICDTHNITEIARRLHVKTEQNLCNVTIQCGKKRKKA